MFACRHLCAICENRQDWTGLGDAANVICTFVAQLVVFLKFLQRMIQAAKMSADEELEALAYGPHAALAPQHF